MSKVQKVTNVLTGLFMLLCSGIMILFPEIGSHLIIIILSAALLVYSLRLLFYYFVMARHMVGGKAVLYRGIIIFDLAIFTTLMAEIPQIYVMLYLLGCYLFSGVIDTFNALEAKRLGTPLWRAKLGLGVFSMVTSIVCLFFIRSTNIFVYIYCGGLISSACIRIANAFRKTAIAYVR